MVSLILIRGINTLLIEINYRHVTSEFDSQRTIFIKGPTGLLSCTSKSCISSDFNIAYLSQVPLCAIKETPVNVECLISLDYAYSKASLLSRAMSRHLFQIENRQMSLSLPKAPVRYNKTSRTEKCVFKIYLLYFSTKAYDVTINSNRLDETIRMNVTS